MADDAIRESMVKRFHTIPGLGLSKAEVLFDAGYTTISSLQKSDAEALSQINGISPALAKYILREVKTMSDEVPSEMVTCATDMPATSKPEDSDSASIKVDQEPVGATSMGKPDDDVKMDSTDTSAQPEAPPEPSGPGFFSSLVGSLKSMFGGGKKEAPPESTEAKPAEPSDTVTVKEETTETKPEEKPTEEKKPEAEVTKEPADVSISVDHEDEPKPEPKKVPGEKKSDPAETKPAPKKGGENEKLVEDIIKELELDKEHR